MKFFCDGCNAKYSIADEKVRGKVVKVRCKRCGDIIEVTERMDVSGGGASASSEPATTPGGPPSPPGQSAERDRSIEWYYSVDGQTYGPFDERDLVEKCRRGEVSTKAYVWTDSFSDWKPAKAVEPFQSALGGGSQRSEPKRASTMGVSGQIEAVEEAPDRGSRGGRRSSGPHRARSSQSNEPTADRGASSSEARGGGSPSRRSRDGEVNSSQRPPESDSEPSARDRGQNGGPDQDASSRSRSRSRNRKRRRNRSEGGGKDDRKERLDRLRNKLKSNFDSSAADGGEEDEVEEEEGDEQTGVDETGAERAASGSESFSEPFGDEIDDEETVDEGGREPAATEDTFSEPFDEDGVQDATVEADVDPEQLERAFAEMADGEESFEVSRQEPPGDAEPGGSQTEASSGPEGGGSTEQGGFELPPSGSSRRDEAAPVEGELGRSSDSAESGLFDDVDGGGEEGDEDKAALPTAPKLGDDEEERSTTDSFADSVSQSLLMQIDKIQDEGKGRRYAVVGAAVAFVLAAAGVWYYVWSTAPEQDDDLAVESDGPEIVTENVEGSGQKTYSEEERKKILTISPQKVDKAEESESEGGEVGERQVAQAQNDGSAGDSDSLRLRGPAATGDDGPSMDEALEGAKKRSGDDDGIDRDIDNSQGATAAAGSGDESSETNDRDFEAMGALNNSTARVERSPEKRERSKGSGSALKSKLSREEIQEGIKVVRKSVGDCRQRHAKRGVPIESRKIYMTLTVEPTGNVSNLELSPDSLYGTIFEKCLHSHKGRWTFAEFEGASQKMKAPFILQQ